MKQIIILAALALSACASKALPCLDKGQAGKILEIEQPTMVPRAGGGGEFYSTILITTDNRTVRVCRAKTDQFSLLHKGMIIVGSRKEAEVDWPNYNWYRIG